MTSTTDLILDDPRYPSKAPGDVLDYATDWSVWLQAGEVIETSEWIVETFEGDTAALSKDVPGKPPAKTSTTTTVWLKGGTLGRDYTVTNHIVTNQGRDASWSKFVSIETH